MASYISSHLCDNEWLGKENALLYDVKKPRRRQGINGSLLAACSLSIFLLSTICRALSPGFFRRCPKNSFGIAHWDLRKHFFQDMSQKLFLDLLNWALRKKIQEIFQKMFFRSAQLSLGKTFFSRHVPTTFNWALEKHFFQDMSQQLFIDLLTWALFPSGCPQIIFLDLLNGKKFRETSQKVLFIFLCEFRFFQKVLWIFLRFPRLIFSKAMFHCEGFFLKKRS